MVVVRAAVLLTILLLCAVSATANLAPAPADAVLPNGWVIRKPLGLVTQTGTMPQGAAASKDGKTIAVVESGFNPSTLRLYSTKNLAQLSSIPLKGAFGRPVWLNSDHVLVAGANADAIFEIDVREKTVRTIPMPKRSYPTLVALSTRGEVAVATDGERSLRIGVLDTVAGAQPIPVAGHVGGLAFSPDGSTLFASNRSSNYVVAVDTQTRRMRTIVTGLHPSDILPVGQLVFVAESDADQVGVYNALNGKLGSRIVVGDAHLSGVSPNALAKRGDTVFVSLGAANSIAVIRSNRVVGRVDAGWYPTDVACIGHRLFIVNGKGEGTRPNPYFVAQAKGYNDYVASIQYGSIRVYDMDGRGIRGGNPQGAPGWQQALHDPVVRKNGPIKHIFFILKENRSYDQVLGDVAAGNGDPKLTWFGARVTPNEHALAARFGLFDNTYASGEVSETGHVWADAAFVNDYMERVWPPAYGRRGDGNDAIAGSNAAVPRNGYIFDAARRAHVSFRAYGEFAEDPDTSGSHVGAPSQAYDRRYKGWDLAYSDVERVREWRREFDGFARSGRLPQLEYIWLPNDHTAGSRAGMLTPVAMVAQNDYAVGLIVDAVSHSPIWRSSAIFIIEDDAQDGPDHVSDQRTTFFLASPYARGGVQHAHYSTVSILKTIERILGMQPLSVYDGMAVPLDAAFTATANMRPFTAILPKVSIQARNEKTAYGASISATMRFDRADENPGRVLQRILAHNLKSSPISGPANHPTMKARESRSSPVHTSEMSQLPVK